MMSFRRFLLLGAATGGLLVTIAGVASATGPLTAQEQLGKSIFFDQNLSLNRNQSCATCHAPAVGFTGPHSMINAHGSVYEGSIPGAFGDRKPPASAYTTMSPVLHLEKDTWVGGSFWDGRATGWRLGSPAAEQAQGPFLNPAEQALADSACVVFRVCTATTYPVSFESVWGAGSCAIAWPVDADATCAAGGSLMLSPETRAKSDLAYDRIAYSIAAYEGSPEVDQYSSKYDLTFGGKVKLSRLEQRGLALFRGKGGCNACHPAGKLAVFTDFTYDNLGVPVNPENPAVLRDPAFRDPGLGGFLRSIGYAYEDELGKHKVPTLRNVGLRPDPALVKAYGHNGYFKSLYGIVHFYNTRDVLPVCPGAYTEAQALAADCWPEPEVAANVNTAELGDLGLTLDEEAAIVAFLETLSDGYQP